VLAAPAGPFALFGHSLGALVGFEVAHRLRARGLGGPVHLWVSASSPPHAPSRRPAVHARPDGEVVARMREWGGTPRTVLEDREMMELVLPVVRADLAAAETYAMPAGRAPLACPVTALGGDGDRTVDDLEGWRCHAGAGFSLRTFPGGHMYVSGEAAAVCREIAAHLCG